MATQVGSNRKNISLKDHIIITIINDAANFFNFFFGGGDKERCLHNSLHAQNVLLCMESGF